MTKTGQDIDEITFQLYRNAIGLGPLPPSVRIYNGEITDTSGSNKPLEIYQGISYADLREIDQWNAFTMNVLTNLYNEHKDDPGFIAKVRTGIMLEDLHWKWTTKALSFWQDEYIWYSLKVDASIEAVAIIYHPKQSSIDSQNIYYIEYLSSAPWNRSSAFYPKKYHGLGTELLKRIQLNVNATLKYRLGFSLHSLPQAVSFYLKLGMIGIESCDKGQLKYLEMPEPMAKIFCTECRR